MADLGSTNVYGDINVTKEVKEKGLRVFSPNNRNVTDAVNSASSTIYASAKAAKTAYEKGVSAQANITALTQEVAALTQTVANLTSSLSAHISAAAAHPQYLDKGKGGTVSASLHVTGELTSKGDVKAKT